MQGKRSKVGPGLFLRDGVFSVGYRCPHTDKWRMKNLSAKNRTEAKKQQKALLAKVGRGPAPTKLAFEAAFSEWQDSRFLSARTLRDECYVLDLRLSALKRRPIQGVTTAEVGRLLRELRGRYAEWTCVKVDRILAGTFNHAVRRGYLEVSPMKGLAPAERPKQKNAKEVARLEPAVLDKLVRSGKTARWRAALGLAAWAGLRLAELRGLTWGDVDLEAGVIRVRRTLLRDGAVAPTKTEAGLRDIPLIPDLRKLLVAWKLEAPLSGESDYVIASATGSPVMERNLRRVLEAAKADAGLDQGNERLSWHSLRHSFASLLATNLDLPPTVLAQIIGHTDAGFTLRKYARDTRDTATLVADVLARAEKAGIGS